jgi:hypothetical protein
MVFAAAALFLQLSTMAYCTHVYLRSLFDRSTSTTNSSGLPSYDGSVRTVTARQAYRRIRRILQLQWRGVALVSIIIANVIYFAVVFIELDNAAAPTAQNVENATPWLLCLVESRGDREKCHPEASAIGPNEATLLAVVILLSLVGFWNFILFARPSMFAGWLDLFKRASRRNEFVSADAHARFADNKGFEMLTTSVKSPDTFMRSPSPNEHNHALEEDLSRSPIASPSPTLDRTAHFGQEARYIRPSMSFSGPRPPESPTTGREWDPQATFAPGHARD